MRLVVTVLILLCLEVNSLTCSSSLALTSPCRSEECRQRMRRTAIMASSTSLLETGRTRTGVLENCVEAGLSTMGAFVSGSLTGYVWGLIMGSTWSKVPDVGVLKSMRIKANQMAGSWGMLTASFAGFTSVSKVIRGRDDKWDQVCGACGAGAFLCREQGPRAMAQGCLSYSLLTLLLASPGKKDELDTVDIPVNRSKQF